MPAGVGDDQVGLQRGDDLKAGRLAGAHRGPVVADDGGIGGNDGFAPVIIGNADRGHADGGQAVHEAVFEHHDALRRIRYRRGAQVMGNVDCLRRHGGKHQRAGKRGEKRFDEHELPRQVCSLSQLRPNYRLQT